MLKRGMLLGFVVCALVQPLRAEELKSPVGTPLPTIIQPNLAGDYIFLTNICYPGNEQPRKPRSVVVLNFMASWCGPCKNELPALLSVWRELKDRGVRLFLVSQDTFDQRKDLDRVLQQYGVDAEVLLDPHHVAAAKLGVAADGKVTIPQTFVVSRVGIIVAHLRGEDNGKAEHFREAIEKGLAATP